MTTAAITAFLVLNAFIVMLIHELGHLAAARKCGVTVSELSIGFGRALVSFRLSGVQYSLRVLPLGSFVRLNSKEMNACSARGQLFIHLAGISLNLVAALATWGTIFSWMNLLLAAANALPIYQHDGWKCGRVLFRSLLGFRSRPVEWTFTFSGVVVSLVLVHAAIDLWRQIV